MFTEFIQGVSQFSVKGDKESKLRFAFRIYDMDNDGYISNGELFQVFWPYIYFLWYSQNYLVLYQIIRQFKNYGFGRNNSSIIHLNSGIKHKSLLINMIFYTRSYNMWPWNAQ